jgi:DNA replication protein DnaC
MYGYDNYQKVKELIGKRREDAIHEAEARDAELCIESREIREIDNELTGTGLLLFKTACMGGDLAPIKERNAMLIKKREEVLVKLGYPADYSEIKYTCPICCDTGYEGSKLCSCFRELLIKENIRSSGIGNLIEKQSFDNFRLDIYEDEAIRKEMAHNLSEAKKYASEFSRDSKNLLLIGTTGTGKTHLTTAIAREIIERGFEVIYDSAQNVVAAFEYDRFKSGYGQYEARGEKYLECELLILDDLGTEFANQFTVSCLYNLLNTRLNKGLPTIISTNLGAGELLSRYEDRIYSRILGQDTVVLRFLGRDKRLSR